jgi:hypothetical protein
MYDVYWLATWLSRAGSKYLEYISRIRNAVMTCLDHKGINEIMSQNILIKLSECEQCTIHKTRQFHKWSFGGTQEGNCMRLSVSSPHGSYCSRDCQAGRLDCMNGGQRQLKGGNQAQVYSDQMVLVMARQWDWTAWAMAKDTQMKVGKQLYAAKGPTKTWEEWPPNKQSQLTLSQRMLKRWDVRDNADDEVRTTMSLQICVTATLITGEPLSELSIYSSCLISASEV